MKCKKTNKRRYADKATADQALATIKRHSSKSKIPQRSYWCVSCDGWHLTSRSQSENDKYKNRRKKATQHRVMNEAERWIKKKGWDKVWR